MFFPYHYDIFPWKFDTNLEGPSPATINIFKLTNRITEYEK